MKNAFEDVMQGLREAEDYVSGKSVHVRKQKVTVLALPDYQAEDIKRIRKSVALSQKVFSGILGVSLKTVEAWESGRNIPKGPALRMLKLLNDDPSIVRKLVCN